MCAQFPVSPSALSTQDLAPGLRGELRQNEPMAKHVSWRVGGTAERAYFPADLDDLARFLRGVAPDEPLYFVGLGSNLLVRDGGVRGTVVFLHGALKEIRFAGGLVYAQAGVASPKVARFAALHELQGAEFLAGIPGTVGGALAMNAGCYGSEIWNVVAKVQTIDRSGILRERTPQDYAIGYRSVLPRDAQHRAREEWFVAAWFELPAGDGAAVRERIKQLLARRIASQPLQLPNAGSVFRNPPGDFAARLIEACGLKSCIVGGAQVSHKHANFIVNIGAASAADIEALIAQVQATVRQVHGIELEREVRIIGEAK